MIRKKCLVSDKESGCRITSNCSQEMITLGEGTDPNIAVLCSKHVNHFKTYNDFHKRDLEQVAEAVDYKGSLNSSGWFDRVLAKAKEDCQKAADKEIWLEVANDFEEQLNSVKSCLKKWIELVSKRVK